MLSPVYFYYSRNIQPEVPMLAAALGGLWCWQVWREDRSPATLAAALGLFALGAMMKPQGAMVAAPAFLDAVEEWRSRGSRVLVTLVAAISLPVVLWYGYARWLSEAYGSFPYFGSFLYEILRAPIEPFRVLGSPDFLWNVLLRGIRTDYLSYAGFTALLIGLWFGGSIPAGVRLRIAAWVGLGFAWLFLSSSMIRIHEYYALPLIPALVIVSGHGLAVLLRHPNQLLRVTAVALALLAPEMALTKTIRSTSGDLTPALVGVGERLDPFVPRDARVIIGPDPSPVVALYHAHRRGWSFPTVVGAASFPHYVARGAGYLISADRAFEQNPSVRPFLDRQVAAIGEVRVFALRSLASK
jgi:hypothetical protein